MKTGIVGGTFDPIHVAHSYLMEECVELLGLDRLLVIPNGDPPHKADTVTSGAHRLAEAAGRLEPDRGDVAVFGGRGGGGSPAAHRRPGAVCSD